MELVPSCTWAARVRTGAAGRALTRLEKLVLMVVAAHTDGASLEEITTGALAGERATRTVLRTLSRDGLVVHRTDDTTERWIAAQPAWDGTTIETDETPARPTEAPTAAALCEGLLGEQGVLDGFLEDFADDPVTAYRFTLAAIAGLSESFGHVCKDLSGYLRNAVIARAIADTGHEITGRDLGRVCREARVLGSDGGDWVVAALYATASADITGNAASYVIRCARSMAERSRADGEAR